MGSGSSRPVFSAHGGQSRKRQLRKKKGGVLVPFLRSMSCGAASSWRTEDIRQGSPMHPATQGVETLDCQNISGKALATDLCNDVCAPFGICNGDGEKLGHMLCDGSSSSNTSPSPLQNSECNGIPDQGAVSEYCSRSENSCSSDSNNSMVYLDRNAKNRRWDLIENEANPAVRHRRPSSSFSDIIGGSKVEHVGEDGSRSFDTTSQQVDVSVPSRSSAGLSSLESGDCGEHEVNAADSFQSHSRTQSLIRDNSGVVVNPPTFEQDESISASEAAVGSSAGDHRVESEQSAISDISRGNSDASRPESIGVLHVEALGLLTQSSGESSSSSRGDVSGREARRNNRRRLWDALTRATSRRRTLSPTFVVASEDIDGLGSWNDGWGLFDWSSMTDDEPMSDEGGFVVGRSSEVEERRWRVRPQVWALQRLSGGFEGGSGHSRPCASGRHPDGRCSCEAYVMTEETSTRASISRIVMLAEALFEVLDEIHRQSVALSRSTSLSLVSLPAPDAVVDSFPLRIHNKTDKTENTPEEAAQCYICLIEYEDGDRVRTLPCHHEYHMACVDKWLKEVHRVCPLCRGNVCDLSSENTVSSVA